ncbi:hypothetical protein D3C75_899760 [compost metagenome]
MAPINSCQLPLRRGRISRIAAFSASEPVTSRLTPTRWYRAPPSSCPMMPPRDCANIARPASARLLPSSSKTYMETSGHIREPPVVLMRLAMRNTFNSRGLRRNRFMRVYSCSAKNLSEIPEIKQRSVLRPCLQTRLRASFTAFSPLASLLSLDVPSGELTQKCLAWNENEGIICSTRSLQTPPRNRGNCPILILGPYRKTKVRACYPFTAPIIIPDTKYRCSQG